MPITINMDGPRYTVVSSGSYDDPKSEHHRLVGIGICICVITGIVLALLFSGVFSTSSSSTSSDPLVGVGDNLQISVLPDVPPPPPSRRSDRRAYTSISTTPTEYDLYKASEQVNVPGSDTLDTVNMIICFIGSTGLFAVDKTTGTYKALVDMTRCQKGQRNAQTEIYMVTAYNLDSSFTETSSSFSGNVGFRMRSTEDTELRAEIDLTLYSVPTADICPGVAIKSEVGATRKTCWTGGMKWKEGDRMSGHFTGSYDTSNADFPVNLVFKQREQGNSSLVMRMDTTGLQVQAKMMQTMDSTPVYYCINANATHARITKSAAENTACATTISGGMCVTRELKTVYPFSFRLFNETNGKRMVVDGITNLNLEYLGAGDVQCHAGVSSSGSYSNCGSGDAAGITTFADGTAAADYAGLNYTLHNSNARVEKLTIKSVDMSEFSVGSYLSYFTWVQAENKFYNYILGYSSTNGSVLACHFKRYATGNTWTDFVATETTLNIGTADIQAQACKMNAIWYTGTSKPDSSNWFSFVSDYRERIYSPTDGKVYFPVSNGIVNTDTDVDLVCPVLCTRLDTFSGTCYDYTKCPKTVHNGLTFDQGCTGSSCISFPRVNDTAYKYKFKASDRRMYALQDNAGSTITATLIDSTTNVTYDASMQWQQTALSRMYTGTDASTLNTAAKVATYMKTSGNVYYEVGIGMKGGYSGWTFYAKDSDAAFVNLVEPVSCKVTMGADANGDTGHSGSVLYLTFYDGFTNGLRFDALSFGNVAMGSRQMYVPSPQLADATQCINGDDTYRIKSEYNLIVPNEADLPCTAWSTMVSPGDLPSVILDPDNKDTTTPISELVCVSQRNLTYASTDTQTCKYYAGAITAG